MKDRHSARRATVPPQIEGQGPGRPQGQERTPLPYTMMRNLDWWGKLRWVLIGVALECLYLLVYALAPIATVYPQVFPLGRSWASWTLVNDVGAGSVSRPPTDCVLACGSGGLEGMINRAPAGLYYLLGIIFLGLGGVYLYAVISASSVGEINRGILDRDRMPTRGIPTDEQSPYLSPRQPPPRWGKGGRVSRDVVTPLVGVRFGLLQKVSGRDQRNVDAINRVPTVRWLLLPLIGAAVFGITLLFAPALFSTDIFMYISASRMPNIYYGPLWLGIAGAINVVSTQASSELVTIVLLFRGLALLVHLINCVLVWAILSKIAPTRRLFGTLLYAWNPLVLIELVVNGHNDGVAICLLLLAVWFYVQQRGGWFEIMALLCCGLAISVNLMVLLIMPLLLWFMIRGERHIARALVGSCWRGLVVLAMVCIVYAPVWQGGVTFLAIVSSIDMQNYLYSLLALLVTPLSALYSQLTGGITLPSSLLQPVAAADTTILASTIFIFALLYFQAMGRVRNDITINATGRDKSRPYNVLFTSWTVVILGFVVLASTVFWPWYIVWVVWIVALRRFDALTITVLLLSCTALLYYPFLHLDTTPAGIYVSLCIFGIPFVYLIAQRYLPLKRAFLNLSSSSGEADVEQRPLQSPRGDV